MSNNGLGTDPVVTDCTFTGNTASGQGGAVFSESQSNPSITDSTLSNNVSSSDGGAIACWSGNFLTLTRCTIEDNQSFAQGGAVFLRTSEALLRGCTFSRNQAPFTVGGAMALDRNDNVVIVDCSFVENVCGAGVGSGGGNGGGIYAVPRLDEGTVRLINCRFIRNEARRPPNSGNGFGGGVFAWKGLTLELTNCLFSNNTADKGAGLYVNPGFQVTITNCTFAENAADSQGGGIFNLSSSPFIVRNTVLWGNTDTMSSIQDAQFTNMAAMFTVERCCIQDDDPNDANIPFGGGSPNFNIDDDPAFTTPAAGDYRLSTTSPCIDAGNNDTDIDAASAGVQTLPLLDLDGNPRRVDDPNTADCANAPGTCGTPPIVDMGAYEFSPPGLAQHGSKVVHGSAGEYLIESDQVECRDIQGAITVVFIFDEPIYSADGDAFVAADFTLINGASPSVVQSDDRTLEVSCINVLDEQCFGISFTVENAAGDEAALDFAWPILAGDTDGDGLVDTDDADLVTLSNSNPLDENNFRCDLDMDGVIEGEAAPPGDDRAIVDAADGHGLLPCQPVATKQVSRKQHGQTSYDIADGGVEPRTGDLVLVFSFDRVMRSPDNDNLVPADFTISSGTVTKVAAGWDWSTIKVTVTGATDAAAFTISFDAEDEDGFATHTEACWSMLVGDVDGDGATTASDTAAIQAANRAAITSSNFRCDIDTNGQIAGAAPDTTDHDLADANVGQTTGGCN